MPRVDVAGLTAMQDEIFVYTGSSVSMDSCLRLGRAAGGLMTRSEATANAIRRAGYDGALLVDPSRYLRSERRNEQIPLLGLLGDAIDRQSGHRVTAYLSPSPFVPDGDVAALQSVIDDGVEFCGLVSVAARPAPGFLVLPIARRWLTVHVDVLLHRLIDAAVPVALVLADPNDPLESTPAIEGLVTLVQHLEATALLRADLSTIGAIASGALMGSIGTSTSYRHLVPPTKNAGGTRGDALPRVLIKALMAFIRGSKFTYLEGGGDVLVCRCPTCDGRSVARFGQERFAGEALFHNQHVWQEISGEILGHSRADRATAWGLACRRAIDAHQELEERTGVDFKPPGYLSAWSHLV